MFQKHELPRVIRALFDAGHHAPSADNSQPWRFRWDGDVITISYDRERLRGQTFGPDNHATLLTMGAVRENLLQMAGWLGLDGELLSTENNRHPPTYARLKFERGGKLQRDSEHHPLFRRHTNRFPYEPSPIDADILETLQPMKEGNCRILVLTDGESVHKLARWVRTASEVRFQTKELHEFLGRSLRFSAAEADCGDGLDVRTLNLPLGGTAFLRLIQSWSTLNFLNRFKFYKFLARVETHQMLNCSAVLAVVGPSTNNDTLDAGSLMERAWIHLNSRGIAVQPYYVVTDQIERLKLRSVPDHLEKQIVKLRSEVTDFLHSDATTIHMLFRIGLPRSDPLRSKRLPIETVTEGRTLYVQRNN